LSHDQVEAALMRRAGYESRILPVEMESYEDNPPTILEFIRRDHRWCNGNMQYFRLMGLRGLTTTSRFQIISAIAMYFGGPAWMVMTLAAASMMAWPADADGASVDFALGMTMFSIMFSMSLAPKIAGWFDAALTPGGLKRSGGAGRLVAGALIETLFSMLMAPIVALAVTVFMAGLPFGRRIAWSGQQRDLTRVGWAQAARAMWPQTLMGLSLTVLILWSNPGVLPWAAPVLTGLTLSIPFAKLTADARLAAWARRHGLCGTPEDFAPPECIARLSTAGPGRPAEAA
jgi:membrane glycosyltransferase